MGVHSGTRVQNATHLKHASRRAGDRVVMIHPSGINVSDNRMLVFCDVTTDSQYGWHLALSVFPRDEVPYVAGAVRTNNKTYNGVVPMITDTLFKKITDSDIHAIMNAGIKQTRTQWWHTSLNSGSVWADGSLTNDSTMYNEFMNPSAWASNTTSPGGVFRRRLATTNTWTDWMTAFSGTCSEAAGGWSNWYEQSCVRSWRAGCEGGPALFHACNNPPDRANKLLVWVA